ncbi:MAG: NAD(P)-binding protein [Bacteroidales bacterium]|nr:NAD(P)-binding protein [Bacteroidales bacterium]
MRKINTECCVLGAGPAGLAAALELSKKGIKDIVIVEKNSIVGGLSRTEIRDNYRFDVGPHRFFTKNKEINALWHNTLGKDFIPVERLTRIYYKNKFFNYPIKAGDVVTKLGPVELFHAMASFALAKLKPKTEENTFEEWISNRFGTKLFNTFFKTYTEKVWGIPCNEIGAEWAAQRIKGLDIIEVIKNSFGTRSQKKIKTLVDQFDYPLLGAGQMYEAWADKIHAAGAEILLSTSVKKFNLKDSAIASVICVTPSGEEVEIIANQYFSSIPLTHFFKLTDGFSDEKINRAVNALYYRDHITVDLLIDEINVFPDQWIYIHSPEVKMARIANYNNFSKKMVNHENKTALSVEYFAFQTEELWKTSDNDLIELAKDELKFMGLADREKVVKAWVVRETESYPTYYLGFKEHYETLKNEIGKFTNLYPVGRGGMYKYNNQDHSIMSGLLAARNYLTKGEDPYNLWDINEDAEYHESAARENKTS